mmetsp:Transcript_10029/g.27317  ORF Transcript_10029/g.27317 Transcript_10029/m.27317 type:complete len:85 (-) Transcript_10029:3178-3432(-)
MNDKYQHSLNASLKAFAAVVTLKYIVQARFLHPAHNATIALDLSMPVTMLQLAWEARPSLNLQPHHRFQSLHAQQKPHTKTHTA